MTDLEKLYQERDTFTKYCSEVPAALSAKIAEAEKEELKARFLPILKEMIPKELQNTIIDGNMFVVLEYNNGILKSLGISRDIEKMKDFDNLELINDLPEKQEDEYLPDTECINESEELKVEKTRADSIGFTVHFGDGKVVAEKTAIKTMIESFRYMGLERVSRFNETFAGYPLVGRQQRITPDGKKWNTYVDGWWIYTNMSNKRKKQCIEQVAEMLNIRISINSEDIMDEYINDQNDIN